MFRGMVPGDLFAHINVWTPTKISKDEKSIIEKLKKSENFQPKAGDKDKGFFKQMRDMFS